MKSYHYIFLLFLLVSCGSEENNEEEYTPKYVDLEIPTLFQEKLIAPLIPADNPLTEEGISLGKKLFFDPILSQDNSMSCSSCHHPENSFTDTTKFSEGVDGNLGIRNSMPLFNLAWNFDERFAWDGKEFGLETQALEPVTNALEMHSDWTDVVNKLQEHAEYPTLFKQAFGITTINSTYVTKAIAQFERTLISANSKFDQYLLGQTVLSENELNGLTVFLSEEKGDCFHCHGNENEPLWTDNDFHNNGLDTNFTDLGLGSVTGDPNDNGKFKSPSLRNLVFTAPYMHDGRFETLDEVIDHYSEGLQRSATIDPLMKQIDQGGVNLSQTDKADLKAFLLTLSDYEFINNTNFQE